MRKGLRFGSMFKDSGMNHYIGGWDMAALDEDQPFVIVKDQLSVIVSVV